MHACSVTASNRNTTHGFISGFQGHESVNNVSVDDNKNWIYIFFCRQISPYLTFKSLKLQGVFLGHFYFYWGFFLNAI